MKTKDSYSQPAIEILELEMEEVIATSRNLNLDEGKEYGGESNARRRDFWE